MTMSLDEKQSQIIGTQKIKERKREWTLWELCTKPFHIEYTKQAKPKKTHTEQTARTGRQMNERTNE